MSVVNQIKTIFVLCCPSCGLRYDNEMEMKHKAGYNVTCSCGVYIE